MDKNFFIAILVATLIILLYSSPQYQKRFGNPLPPKKSIEQPETGSRKTSEVDVPRRETVDSSIRRAPQPKQTVKPDRETEISAGFVQINAPASDQEIILENEDLRITLSNRGGAITKTEMKKFNGIEEGEPVQLIVEGESWCEGRIEDGDLSIPLSNLLFSAKSVSGRHVIFESEISGNKIITREFSLESSGFLMNLKTRLSGTWEEPLLQFSWHGPINKTERPFKKLRIWPFTMFMRDEDNMFSKIVYLGQGERKTTDTSGKEKVKRIYTNDGGQKLEPGKSGGEDYFVGEELEWYAVRSKYFMSAAIPDEKMRWQSQAQYSVYGSDRWFDFTISKHLSDGNTDLSIFIGPIQYDILKGYGNNLTESMELSFRFIRPISILFLWLFKKLHTFISNWGLVIIVFSIIIKIVLYPLSHKSFVSMRKMSSLQPQINELKLKYKNNQQMLHKATMELYKKEGVNPFSGCLPMLLQMPVFFALYPVVGRAFELRQAMFIPHWIEDLSRPDPFYILPVAMGISMFFQSRTTMKDPNQKAMLYIMPVMMVILFANFSSGLTLYWFLFNVMSFMQQKFHS